MYKINNVFPAHLPWSLFATNKIHLDDTKPKLFMDEKQANIFI